MRGVRPPGRRRRSQVVSTFFLLILLPRLLLTEEARPDRRMYPAVPSPDGLLPQEKEYMDWVDNYVPWLIRVARTHLIRHQVLMYTSGISALAIPLAIALQSSSWIPASLAFIAAVSQFAQVGGQDQKLYILHHEQASKIQKARRDFSFDTTVDGYQPNMRNRFNTFRQTVEKIKEESGVQTLRIRGQEPPQMESGHLETNQKM